ncbi:MAG TPA: C45 family peptidase [Labilithrix sp.]|nr:C45 family peptidase [Labilithrix sp.]
MTRPSLLRRHKKKLIALGLVLLAPLAAHLVVDRVTHLEPPAIRAVALTMSESDGVRRAGAGWSVVRGVRIAHLAGTPEEIGTEHSTLLRDRMIANEAIVWDGFKDVVPFGPARVLLFDAGRYRYRHVEAGFPEARRREVAAEAAAFTPDPFARHMATYPRMVFLHSLYDIALSFEHSPLLGCTAFGLGPEATGDGHALFARAFDFEAADVFDRDKAVFVVREQGKIPFASVAWPGLVGVVTGMNAEGVAVAVNGGRAREPSTTGMPVAFSLREALEEAHDTTEAIAVLSRQSVMVSHLVFVGDAKGHYAVVERAPGIAPFVRESTDPARIAVTNHFEGPLGGDPRDVRVRETTTTLPRRARADELVLAVGAHAGSVKGAVAMLRDHACAGGEACPLGDRRTLDAFIATHGVVFDLTARAAWVSVGPHLSGAFVKIDLAAIVSTKEGVVPTAELETIPADDVLSDERYNQGRERAGGPLMGPGARPPRHGGPR